MSLICNRVFKEISAATRAGYSSSWRGIFFLKLEKTPLNLLSSKIAVNQNTYKLRDNIHPSG
jgi:hypothetical protein